MDYCGFAEHARLKADNKLYHKLLNDAHVMMGNLQLKVQELELELAKLKNNMEESKGIYSTERKEGWESPHAAK